MSTNPISSRVRESVLGALKEYATDEGVSHSKAIENNLEVGLRHHGYLDEEPWSSGPIIAELARFAAYGASVLLGVHIAMDIELLGYAVVLLVIALLALATDRLLPTIGRLLRGEAA